MIPLQIEEVDTLINFYKKSEITEVDHSFVIDNSRLEIEVLDETYTTNFNDLIEETNKEIIDESTTK